jgi:hypothetical protein
MKAYTCPWLMWIQYALMRAWPLGRPVRISGGRVVRVMPKGHGVEARVWWPRWAILAECRLHHWLMSRRARRYVKGRYGV